MRMMLVTGTRPEVIKMAPIVRAARTAGGVESVLVNIGQHREMTRQMLALFEIEPAYEFDVMRADQSLAELSARVLREFVSLIEQASPDVILVQGDTISAFMSAVGAFFCRVPIGHVEAGLRTYRKYNPFPEEMSRRLLSHIADFHFAPTDAAHEALLRENIPGESIWVTGNTVIDSLLWMIDRQREPERRARLLSCFRERYGVNLPADGQRIVLVTAHRREIFGRQLDQICRALAQLAGRFEDVLIIYPVHLNPNVEGPVRAALGSTRRVHLLPPLDYEEFVFVMQQAHLILTDSGGVQEEAPTLGKPVLVMREATERPEGVAAGSAEMVGCEADRIVQSAAALLDDWDAYARRTRVANPYGDGHAAERIVSILSEHLG